MGRIRSVHPGYNASFDIAALSIPCRMHFVALWTYTDDDGRGVDDPRLIKGAIWPLDDDVTPEQIEAWQAELEANGRIIRYQVCGRRYFAVDNWNRWQRPKHPKPSEHPLPPETPSDLERTSPGQLGDMCPQDGPETGERVPETVHGVGVGVGVGEGEGGVYGGTGPDGTGPDRSGPDGTGPEHTVELDPEFELVEPDSRDGPTHEATRTAAAALDELCGRPPRTAAGLNQRRDDIRQLVATFARHKIPPTADSIRTLAGLYRADMTASLTAHGLANHADRLICQAQNGALRRRSDRDVEDATRQAEYADLIARKGQADPTREAALHAAMKQIGT